ncbi:unnamed protein product [Microthlaspi erraticum]|uniref:Malectin-like domain-containing protein n=1 Tax=Microthlaspi erraticum TaxID=1685480 RepID=A0A6D2IPD3_9BRAS|nr:unnamed protein product [Microthlaspi erraticum]
MEHLFLVVLVTLSFGFSEASIQLYRNEEFTAGTNSRYFHGGSEAVHASTADDPAYIRIEAKMLPETVIVNKTGLYDIYFLICDKDLEGTTVTGRSMWRSPGGYLSAKDAPLLTFIGVIVIWYMSILLECK